MIINKFTASLLIAVLSFGMANAAVIENIKATAHNAGKFTVSPKIVDVAGEKAFVIDKGYVTCSLKERIKVDPEKKYQVSVKIKQFGENPALVYIGFIPYTAKGVFIAPEYVTTVKNSSTTLTATAAKDAKTLTVKDASNWGKGKYYHVAFGAKEDMSDLPNFDISSMIAKVEKKDNAYTVTLTQPLAKTYPAGTVVRQHRSGGTYIYTKHGYAPKAWTDWKGWTDKGKVFRKATYIRPMIMINATQKYTGAAFTDFVVEELK